MSFVERGRFGDPTAVIAFVNSSDRNARGGANDAGRGRWVVRELRRRANGTARQLSAAVGTNKSQFGGGAVNAVRALEGADVGVRRTGRKITIATLAIRSEFQRHRMILRIWLRKASVQLKRGGCGNGGSPRMTRT